MNITGQRLIIGEKEVQCPAAPLYFIKSFGQVVDICRSPADATDSFNKSVASDKAVYKLNDKGMYSCTRLVRGGRERS